MYKRQTLTHVVRQFVMGGSVTAVYLMLLFLILLFLLIPALNLSGLNASRMQDRISELGVRKAFGARKNRLLTQILIENLLLMLPGGLVGLLVSYGMVALFQQMCIRDRVDKYTYYSPLGFDIEDTYKVQLGILAPGTPGYVDDSLLTTRQGEDVLRLAGLLRQAPEVEEVSISHVGCVYTENRSWSQLYRADADTSVSYTHLMDRFRLSG